MVSVNQLRALQAGRRVAAPNVAPVLRDVTPEDLQRLQALATRIMGYPLDQAAANLLVYELARARIYDADRVLPRPLIVSDILTGVGAGAHNLVWTFATLGVVTAVSAVLYPGQTGETGLNLALAVRKGAEGGYVIGTDTDPAAWSSFGTLAANYDSIRPLPIQPSAVRSTNQWSGVLTIDNAIGENEVDLAVNFYGVALWGPDGQIAT